jgi:hypothetical protein
MQGPKNMCNKTRKTGAGQRELLDMGYLSLQREVIKYLTSYLLLLPHCSYGLTFGTKCQANVGLSKYIHHIGEMH